MSLAVLPSADALAAAAATWMRDALGAALATEDTASLAVPGGRTPVGLYRRLAEARPPLVDWSGIGLWFTDERAVPPEDARSNYRLVREALIDPARISTRRVHRIQAERGDLESVAEEYARELPVALDVVLLGIGEDGHVASLFPGSPWIEEATRRVAVVDAPKPPPRRITLTGGALRAAKRVLVLAAGEAKAEAVARALALEGDSLEVPARLVRERDWLVDREAAARLTAAQT